MAYDWSGRGNSARIDAKIINWESWRVLFWILTVATNSIPLTRLPEFSASGNSFISIVSHTVKMSLFNYFRMEGATDLHAFLRFEWIRLSSESMLVPLEFQLFVAVWCWSIFISLSLFYSVQSQRDDAPTHGVDAHHAVCCACDCIVSLCFDCTEI